MRKGNFKKMMSAALSAAMCGMTVFSVAVPVYATEVSGDVVTGSSSLTVDKAVAGHSYKVYQIFTGDVDKDGKTLSNVRYGANFGETGEAVPADVLDGITDAKQFAKDITSDGYMGGYTANRLRCLRLTNPRQNLKRDII